MGYRLGSMFFLALLVALCIMPLYASVGPQAGQRGERRCNAK